MLSFRKFMTTTFAALIMAVFTAGPAAAQSSSDASSAQSSIELTAVLGLTFVNDMSFPSTPLDGATDTVRADIAAEWSYSASTGSDLTIDFVLPTTLSDVDANTIPIGFPVESAGITNCGVSGGQAFDPNTSFTCGGTTNSDGIITVGSNFTEQGQAASTEAGDAFVDVSGANPGTYTGTIDITVTAN